MLECPNCNTTLVRERNPLGLTFACPSCNGRMAGLAFLRNNLFSQEHLNNIWKQARDTSQESSRTCPHCEKKMKVVHLYKQDTEIELDVCTLCQQVWFDAGEDSAIPHAPPLTSTPPTTSIFPDHVQSRINSGDCNREDLNELDYSEEESPDQGEAPDSALKSIWGYLGLPIEVDAPKIKIIPWMTYAIILILLAVMFLNYTGQDTLIKNWGLIPHDWSRHYGLTLLTSFFIHGGIVHLLSNIYFLYISGDNVEQELGPWKFLTLLLLSDFAGNLLFGLFNYSSTIPCIGASGGICGIMVFYAITFPQARIGMHVRNHNGLWDFDDWVYIPVPIAILLFIAIQFGFLYYEANGSYRSGIAVLAHIGGMLPGIAWAIWRRLAPRYTGLKENAANTFDVRQANDNGGLYKF